MAQKFWGMTGRKHSKETRLKMSLKKVGNKNAEGQVISENHKQLLSQLKMGVNNPNWRGGVYLTNNEVRRSPIYKRWQKAVYLRDDYTCQICGVIGKDLRANHIKKFSSYPELRFTIENGITICRSCDISLVMYKEPKWESYFNFNLMTRGVI